MVDAIERLFKVDVVDVESSTSVSSLLLSM